MMNNKKQLSGEIVTRYLEKFPNTSSIGLARIIYAENNLAFNSVEHARTMIRMYRGSQGDRSRKSLTDKRFFDTGISLPIGEEPEYMPYELPKVNNRILYMADIHLPFHDQDSIKIALEDAKDKNCNTVILGGDILDFYTLSVFDKIPLKSSFIKEREMFWQLIDYINSVLHNAKVMWLEGNHEYRFNRYMLHKCAEIFDVDDFSMRLMFSLRELGVEYIDGKRYINAGSLSILHGHEFGNSISSPVNPARGMYLKAKDSALFGHLHRTSEHAESDLRGNVKTCYSTGCLCNLHPQYRPLNSWNSGFALVEIKNDGTYMCKNKKIVNGKIQ